MNMTIHIVIPEGPGGAKAANKSISGAAGREGVHVHYVRTFGDEIVRARQICQSNPTDAIVLAKYRLALRGISHGIVMFLDDDISIRRLNPSAMNWGLRHGCHVMGYPVRRHIGWDFEASLYPQRFPRPPKMPISVRRWCRSAFVADAETAHQLCDFDALAGANDSPAVLELDELMARVLARNQKRAVLVPWSPGREVARG
jgi:hypothetical protein